MSRAGPRAAAHRPWLLLALAVVLLVVPIVFGQSFPARLFGGEEGLENGSIAALAQQPDGHLWIATENGLFRYNGAEFREYGRASGLSETFCLNVFIDRNGRVWVSTASGLFYLDGDRFREVRAGTSPIIVRANSRFALSSGSEMIVSTSTGGLLSITRDPRTLAWSATAFADRHPQFRSTLPVWGIFLDRDSLFWYGCGESICSSDVVAQHPFPRTEALSGVPAGKYESFLQDRSGRFWARSKTSVVTWRPGDRKVENLTADFPADVFGVNKLRMTQDSFGNILLTAARGFLSWDGHAWTPTETTSQGSINGATDLLSDNEGNLWIGTAGSGLIESLGYRRWDNFGAAEGLASPIIFAIATSGTTKNGAGKVWIGTKVGLNILPPGSIGNHKPIIASGLEGEKDAKWIENLVATPDGGVWAASRDGHLWHLDRNERIDMRATVPSEIMRLRAGPDGTLWIAGNGLYTMRCRPKTSCEPVKVPDDPIRKDHTFVDMTFDSAGILWIAGDDGLYRLKDGALTHIDIKGIASRFGLITLGADRSLWLAGHLPGVVRVRVDGSSATVIESHSSPELASDFVEILDADASGRIWVGTDQGLNVIDGGKVNLINDRNGLVWKDTDGKAFAAEPDGSLWFGTSGGVSHLHNPGGILDRGRFAANIEETQYGNVDMQSGAAIPWNKSTFTSHFSGLTFRSSRPLIYHYRLEGFDTKTIDTIFPMASFQQLPPGNYVLHVTAEDPGQHFFSTPATFPFTLIAPWWRTHTFQALIAFAGCCVVLLLWYWGNQALLRQRNHLQRLVAERTAELQQLAVTDSLTGMLNRGAIMSTFSIEAGLAQRRRGPQCIALVDLDHFKHVNDTLGHLAGDEVLRETAKRIAGAVRATDAVGRYGGEEFLIVFRDMSAEFGRQRCEAIRQAVCASPIRFGSEQIALTASIGFAWILGKDVLQESLVASADRAVYAAKANGRNRVELDPLLSETEFIESGARGK